MIVAHLPIAIRVARLFASERCDQDELEAVGALALVESARTFDPKRGIQFGPFAEVAVRRAVIRYLATNEHPAYRLPERVWEAISDARRGTERAHASEDERRRLIALGGGTVSLHTLVHEGAEFGDIISSDLADAIAASAETARFSATTERMLESLSARERRIVELRVGLHSEDGRQVGFSAIGREVGLSERQARRVFGKALALLRHPRFNHDVRAERYDRLA